MSVQSPLVSKAIKDEFSKIWLMTMKANIHCYEDFKVSFLNKFGIKGCSQTLELRYVDENTSRHDGTMTSYLLEFAVMAASLQPKVEE
jgi:hypothetical protein